MKRMYRLFVIFLCIVAIALGLAVSVAASAPAVPDGDFDRSYSDIVKRLWDPKSLAVSQSGERSEMFSSYGRKSVYNDESEVYENWNYNGDGGGYIAKIDDNGDGNASELLIAEMSGAGYISRIWSAEPESGHLKIYVDENEPYGYVIDMPFINYFDGTLFDLDGLCYVAAKGYNTYVPITYNKSCRVVAYSGWGRFYQINYTQMPEGVSVQPLSSDGNGGVELTEEQRVSLETANAIMMGAVGTNPSGKDDAPFEKATVESGKSLEKAYTGKGAISGLLVRLSNTERLPNNAEEMITVLKFLRLKAYWDGGDTPAVDVPLGDFFGSSYGINLTQTLLMGVRDDRTLYSYYYMPYLEGARIVIENNSDSDIELEISVTVEESGVDESEMLYFNSVFSFGEYVEERMPDHRFLSVNGAGKFVGVNLHLYKTSDYYMDSSIPGYNWWGEGDEKLFVDGEKFPSWYGTGTEDFFGYAWCSTTLFTRPYHAQGYCTGGGHGVGNHVVTRIMMADSISFESSFEGCLEKYYEDTNYAYTSYLYLESGAAVDREGYTASDALYYFEIEDSAYVGPLSEGEDMLVLSEGKNTKEPDMASSLNWSGDTYLHWTPEKNDDSIELVLPAAKSTEYVVLASFSHSPTGGKFSVSVNGGVINSEIDLYASVENVENLTYVGECELNQGYYNSIAFTLVGKNASNTAAPVFGLDFILVIPKEEYTSIGDIELSKYIKTVTRKNCAPEDYIEGEAMFVASKHSSGTGKYSGQVHSAELSESEQLFWRPAFGNNAWIELYLPAAKNGEYAIYASFMKASNYGIFETYVNGIAIGAPFDGYSSELAVEELTLLGTASLKAGTEGNTIKFKMIGKNASSSGYFMGLDFVMIVPLGEEPELSRYTDKTRRMSDTTQYFEAETLAACASSGEVLQPNSYSTRTDKVWLSRGKQIFWKPRGEGAVGATLDIDFASVSSGKYVIVASFVSAADYGKFKIGINGTTLIEELDLYASEVTSRDLTYVGYAELSAGYKNTMNVTLIGKNDKNVYTEGKYYFSMDFLMLIPYDEYEGLDKIDLSRYTLVDRENSYHDLYIEGENFFVNRAPAAYQYESGWSGHSHNYWKETGTATANLPAPESGEYMLAMAYTKAKDFGMVRLAVNGVSVGCYQDLYKSSLTKKELNIVGKVNLNKGYNILTITNVGKNASATSTLFGIDFIYLIPIDSYYGKDSVSVSGYTTTISTVIGETHAFDDDTDEVCNVCGMERSNIHVSGGDVVTEYGTIPKEYGDPSKYPLAVFQNGEFQGAYSVFASGTEGACAIGRVKQLTASAAGLTAEILLRGDVTVDAILSNQGQILGDILIDLNGYTLTQTKTYLFSGLAKNWKGLDDSSFTLINGNIVLKTHGLVNMGAFGATYASAANASTGVYKTTSFIFKNVNLSLAEGASVIGLLGAYEESKNITTKDCIAGFKYYFDSDCVIDIRNAPEGFTLFNAKDENTDAAISSTAYATNCIVNVEMNGGKIIAGNARFILSENLESNGSSVTFGKDENEGYTYLIMRDNVEVPSCEMTAILNNGVECVFVKVSENNSYVNYSLYPKVMVDYKIKTSVTLYSNFVYNVYIPTANVNGFTINGNAMEYTTETIDGVEYYVVKVDLPAGETLADIKLCVTLNSGNTTVDANWTLNVYNYTKAVLGGNYDDTTKTLMKDMLVYAAAAHTYFENTETVAEKLAEIKTLLGDYVAEMPTGEAKAPADKTYFTDARVYLGEVPSFRFYLASGYTAADFSFKVGNRTVEAKASEDGKYVEIVMYAYMMLDDVTFTVKSNGVTGTYNLYSYYEYAKTLNNANLTAVAEALMKYSVSAKAYRNSVINK